MNPPDVSVIIVAYNSAETIGECIGSALRHTGGLKAEIIVVDNASQDGTAELVRGGHPGVQLIANESNRGFAASCNQAARLAGGTVLLFLNPDAAFLDPAGPLLDAAARARGAGIAGCALVDPGGAAQPSCWRIPSLFTQLAEMFLPYRAWRRVIASSPPSHRDVDSVSGACLAVRRDVFGKLGGFDERFFLYYEDIDLCIRARREGLTVEFIPGVRALHHIGKSVSTDLRAFARHYYGSKILFFAKHRPAWYLVCVRVIVASGACFRGLVYACAGALSMNGQLIRLAKLHTFVVLPLAVRMSAGGNPIIRP